MEPLETPDLEPNHGCKKVGALSAFCVRISKILRFYLKWISVCSLFKQNIPVSPLHEWLRHSRGTGFPLYNSKKKSNIHKQGEYLIEWYSRSSTIYMYELHFGGTLTRSFLCSGQIRRERKYHCWEASRFFCHCAIYSIGTLDPRWNSSTYPVHNEVKFESLESNFEFFSQEAGKFAHFLT